MGLKIRQDGSWFLVDGKPALGCCCKCKPFSVLGIASCTETECANLDESWCCFHCGDTLNITFGAISGNGMTEWAPAASFFATLAGSTSLTLKFNTMSYEGTGDAGWEYVSTGTPGADDKYYGFNVRVRTIGENSLYGGRHVGWAVYVRFWRVAAAAYLEGDCSEAEYIGPVIQPALASDIEGTCCGHPGPLVLEETSGPYFTTLDDVASIEVSSTCDSVCDCTDYASSFLVAAGCVSLTVTNTAPTDGDNCTWTGTSGTAPADTYVVTLDRSACVWRLSIEITHYDEESIPTGTDSVFYEKMGGDPSGVFTRVSGSACNATAEVS